MPVATEAPLPFHPALEKIRRFRLLYAVAVNAVAIVIAVAVLMSMRVREYRTLGQIDIAPPAGSGLPLESANAILTDTVRESASDESLRQVLAAALDGKGTKQEGIASSYSVAQLDLLRQAMAFSIVPLSDGAGIRVTVALSGSGSAAEKRLVQAFLARFADQLARPSRDAGGLVAPEILSEDGFRAMRQRQDASLVQANQQLQAVNTQLVSLAGEVLDLAAAVDQAELENARTTAAVAGGQSVFRQAGFSGSGSENGPLHRSESLREKFAAIPLTEFSKTLAGIEKDWDAAFLSLEACLHRPVVTGVPASPLRALSRSEMRQVPFGLQPPREWLLLAVACALALGCVLASGVDIRTHDAGLGSAEEIEKTLGVPVIGSLRAGIAQPANARRLWSLRILKLNELVVFTTLLTILVVSLSSQEVRQTLIENPLHAVARILWSIRSAG